MVAFREFKSSVAKELWGFHPNRDIKPVHFANGFIKSVCGNRGDIRALQKAAVGYIKGVSGTSNEQFLSDNREAYAAIRDGEEQEASESITALRSALDLVLTQDGALFASEKHSTATLSHFLMTSPDRSDVGTGRFMAEVLASGTGKPSIAVLRQAFSDSDDNIYLLSSPLLPESEMGDFPYGGEEVKEIIEKSPVLKSVQEAFSRLVEYRDRLEKSVFLQKVITLGCFAILLHVINRGQSPEEQQQLGFCPIFFASSNPHPEIRELSRASYSKGRQLVERGFEQAVKKRIAEGYRSKLLKNECLDIMSSMLPNADLNHAEKAIWSRFVEEFEVNLLGTGDMLGAFSKAVARTAFSMDTSPEAAIEYIGKNIGLIYPPGQGKGKRYYLPGPRFLDTLVTALLRPDEEIPIEEFWERARKEMGIVVGIRSSQDMQRLGRWGIRKVSPNHLSRNAEMLTIELIRMGYVREYADDVAVIRGGGLVYE